jgi:transcription antitermination factor NusG
MTERARDEVKTPGDGWFVIWTAARAEKRVESRMAAQGLEPWLPQTTERRRWSDRWRDVVLPLFPGYLFARGELSQMSSILRTPGVITVVKSGGSGRPAFLSDRFVASLRAALEKSGTSATPVAAAQYSPHDEVIVREGPLAGLRGVVQEVQNGRRLIVWIEHIGRGVAFTIGSALVSPVAPASRA